MNVKIICTPFYTFEYVTLPTVFQATEFQKTKVLLNLVFYFIHEYFHHLHQQI